MVVRTGVRLPSPPLCSAGLRFAVGERHGSFLRSARHRCATPALPELRFALGKVSLIVLAVTLVLTVLLSLSRWSNVPASSVVDIGGFAFVFLLAMGLAWVAWRLDARRRAGGVVFCCIMLLFLAGKMSTAALERVNVARHVAQLQELQRQTIAQREREIAARGNPTAAKHPDDKSDADRLQQRAQIFQDASREAQGEDRRMLEVDARIMGAFQTDVKAYETAVAALRADGFVSASGLETRAGLAKRQALVQACAQANATLTESCRTLEERCYAEMRRDLPEPRATDSARRAMIGYDTPLMLRVRDCERRMIEGAGGTVALFEHEFDRWHFNAAKRVVFDAADPPATYGGWIKHIQDAGHEEEGAQREIVARMKTRSGS